LSRFESPTGRHVPTDAGARNTGSGVAVVHDYLHEMLAGDFIKLNVRMMSPETVIAVQATVFLPGYQAGPICRACPSRRLRRRGRVWVPTTSASSGKPAMERPAQHREQLCADRTSLVWGYSAEDALVRSGGQSYVDLSESCP
jgi:hypothetical protein